MEPKSEAKTEPMISAKMEAKMPERAEPKLPTKRTVGKKMCKNCNRQMSCSC